MTLPEIDRPVTVADRMPEEWEQKILAALTLRGLADGQFYDIRYAYGSAMIFNFNNPQIYVLYRAKVTKVLWPCATALYYSPSLNIISHHTGWFKKDGPTHGRHYMIHDYGLSLQEYYDLILSLSDEYVRKHHYQMVYYHT